MLLDCLGLFGSSNIFLINNVFVVDNVIVFRGNDSSNTNSSNSGFLRVWPSTVRDREFILIAEVFRALRSGAVLRIKEPERFIELEVTFDFFKEAMHLVACTRTQQYPYIRVV